MSSQPIEANVVLTADNQQYNAAMNQSAQSTDQLGQSVDSLGTKIHNLSKMAGKTLIGITAADVATISGATAAWSSYEKQVSLLSAQSAILTRTQTAQSAVMKDYTAAVKGLRVTYGTTTAEAANLVQTLSKITSVNQSGDLTKLSKVFVDMSMATGESSEGLASSLTNLQKIMGTPINSANTRKYADQFTYLAAQSNTSAQSLIDFTTQLAPIGRSIGMSQTQVAGFATAFAKAGQDGLGVSTVFTKVATDISKSLATGSPEIAHYANLIGVTNKAFKKMDGAEQFVRILESLHAMGPRAATELDRLGLDGTRSMRSITAVLNEAGGLRQNLGLAQEGAKSGAAGKGAGASTKGLSDDFAKLRQELQMTAEAFGNDFGPAIEKFVQGMTMVAKVVRQVAEGPMGKFMGLIAGIIAPLAGGAGALLLFAGVLLKVASAFTVLRSSAAYGLKEGYQGQSGVVRGPNGEFIASGDRGAQIAKNGTWFQRGQYNVGQFAGSGFSSLREGMVTGFQKARGFVDTSYVPGPDRSMFSYAAGGAGRVLNTLVNPAFDQMRYADPTKRTQYVDQISPFAKVADRAKLVAAMGSVGLAQHGIDTIGKEEERIKNEPLMTNAERQARLDQLKVIREETQARLETHQATETAARESIAAQQEQSRVVKESLPGFRGLAQGAGGFAAGAVGGVMGAGRAGFGALMGSRLGAPMLGMGAMTAASAMGIQSNMITLAAMGAMVGGGLPGALAGGALGAGLDMFTAGKPVNSKVSAYGTQVSDATTSGYGFSDLAKSQAATQAAIDKTNADRAFQGGSIGGALPGVGNAITDFFGHSQQQTTQDKQDANVAKNEALRNAALALAHFTGQKISGTIANQNRQLDDYMSGSGAQQLADAGIDPKTLVAAHDAITSARDKRKALNAQIAGMDPNDPTRALLIDARNARTSDIGTAKKTYQDMLTKITVGDPAMVARISTTTSGKAMDQSGLAQRAIQLQGNVGLLYAATNDIVTRQLKGGSSYLDILKSTEKTQSKIGDENNRQYELQKAASEQAQQALQYQLPLMTRAQGFQMTIASVQAQMSGIMSTPAKKMTAENVNQLATDKSTAANAFVDMVDQTKQQLLIQDQFNIQRQRAQDDYNLQRGYQEHDYHLQRSRAEEAYNRQRKYANSDYNRQVNRNQFQFNLDRSRQESDFNHQVLVQSKQAAMSVYSIYDRVQTQRTASASSILANAYDQLGRMKEQHADLAKLRSMGLSNNVIQQMQLTDPANQQQLARFVTEITPKMIAQFNKTAGTERVKAAKALVTDPSSLEFSEMRRSFELNRKRGAEDFNRAERQGRADFHRGLDRQALDFKISMDQQATDFQTQLDRQEKQYQTSMQRNAEDLANMSKEISGSVKSILTQGAQDLTGYAQQQAQTALDTFTKLKHSTRPVAIALMKDLANIFGFKYQVPKDLSSNTPDPATGTTVQHHQGGSQSGVGMASGGIVPGWTPGRDTVHVPLSGGEAIMRPEWARAMGEGAISAMNHKAKYGGFADGGINNPDGRVYMDGQPVSRITKAQLLLAEKLSNSNLTTIQGSWQPYTTYSGSSHMGPGVVDESPGNFRTQYWMRRVGFAAWGRNFPGAATAGSGAHVHSVSLLDPGAAHQPQIAAFYAGQDGLGGLDYGPNPPMLPGIMGLLSQFHNLTVAGSSSGRHGGRHALPTMASVLKHRYPTAEAASLAMQGVHPLFVGDISNIMNNMAKTRYAQSLEGIDPNMKHSKWYGAGGVFTGPTRIGVGESGNEAVIPLNDEGVNFMAKAIHGAEARGIGMGSMPIRGGMSIYNTRIDKSTNFSGPITVQANNPHELIHKLQARQRVMALSRPSLTGSAA